ncbi:MAG: hypothetical protein ABEH61_00885 [Haloarculaceae archaeon]
MDLEDVLELSGLGLLFGGLEIVGAVLSIVLVLVLIVGLVAVFLWLDFGALQLVVVLGLMIIAALLGGLGGMKIERARRGFTDKYSGDINDWI